MFKKIIKKFQALPLGLEINDENVKLVQLNQKGLDYFLEDYAMVEQGRSLPKAISHCWGKLKHPPRKVSIAIPDSLVINKVIQVPAELNSTEIENLLQLNLGHYIPYAKEEVRWDFQELDTDSINKEILLVASRKEVIANKIAAIEAAGLKVKVVEIESQSILRAFAYWVKSAFKELTAIIIYLNLTALTIIIIEKNKPVFSQCETFTHALTTAQLILQIQRNLQLCANNLLENTEQVFLAGEFQNFSDLFDSLEKTLQKRLLVINPFAELPANFLVGCGLALRGCYHVYN